MPAPLRGFADLHSHLMAHLGFGGKVLAGAPWDEGGLDSALGNCQAPGAAHDPLSTHQALLGAFIRGVSEAHGPCGAPSFIDWPNHLTIYHQQMYLDWLRRAHVHGMRLLCALALNNELLARECGAVRYSDYNMLEAQVSGLRRFVAYAKRVSADAGEPPWLDLAATPAEARTLIANGQLAIVVGIELDTLESLARHVPGGNDEPSSLSAGPSLPTRGLRNQPLDASEVDAVFDVLARFGVSMLTPVHLANNSLAGSAIYDDRFDLLNCWLRGSYFAAEESADVAFQLNGDPVMFELMRTLTGTPPRSNAGLGFTQGHVNQAGLSAVGEKFILGAMRRGLLIDVDHMSEKTTDAVLALATARMYPVISSHSSFRELGFFRNETKNPLGYRHEGMKTAAQLDAILKLGGVVAPVTNQHQCKTHQTAVANDCDGTTKTWAQSFLYAVDQCLRHGKGGVAIGTDFNGFAQQPGPRYLNGGLSQNQLQRVKYADAAWPAYFTGQPLSQQVLPGRARAFDFNVDGLAHVGMLADYVEDLRQIQVPPAAIDLLFNSAEAFVGVWETCQARGAALSSLPPP